MKIPLDLMPPEGGPNGLLFRQLLRNPALFEWLTQLVQAGRSSQSNEKSQEIITDLRREFLQPWLTIAKGAVGEEALWFDAIVQVACGLLALPPGRHASSAVDEVVAARWPEAIACVCLMAEDAGLLPRSRRLFVPVVFCSRAPSSNQGPADEVARLELRFISEARGLNVHPIDRWRRDITGKGLERMGAGPADIEFLTALNDALDSAQDYWTKRGQPPRGGIVWRLLDFYSDIPWPWPYMLEGPSAGGAALRGMLRLLSPENQAIEKYLFVLAQLRDVYGKRVEELQPVERVAQKIENVRRALRPGGLEALEEMLFILPRAPEGLVLSTGVTLNQLRGNVRTIAQLAEVGLPPEFARSEAKGEKVRSTEGAKQPRYKRSYKIGFAALLSLLFLGALVFVIPRFSRGGPARNQEKMNHVPSVFGEESKAQERNSAQPEMEGATGPAPTVSGHGEKGSVVRQADGSFLLSYTLKAPGNPANNTRLYFKVTRPGLRCPADWRSQYHLGEPIGTWIWLGEGAPTPTAGIFHISRNGLVWWAWLEPQVAAYFASDP